MANQHTTKRPGSLVFNKMQIEIARAHHLPHQINRDAKTMVQKKVQSGRTFCATQAKNRLSGKQLARTHQEP